MNTSASDIRKPKAGPHPIYAVKLTMTALTTTPAAWLSAADVVVSRLSKTVPLADWHPLKQISLPAETASEGKQPRATRALSKKQNRQPSPKNKNHTPFSHTPTGGSKQASITDSTTEQRRDAAKLPSSSPEKFARSSSRPASQLTQLAQLSQLQLEEPASELTQEKNRPSTKATPSAFDHTNRQQNASTDPSPKSVHSQTEDNSRSESDTGNLSSLIEAFAQSADDESAAGLSLNAIDSIEKITRQLLGKDTSTKRFSPRNRSSFTANSAGDRTVTNIQPNAYTSSNNVASSLSPTVDSRHSSVAESAFLSELTAQSTAHHLRSPITDPTEQTGNSTGSNISPIAANGFEVSPAIAETLTDWVNDTLKEQAHRHGVDLS